MFAASVYSLFPQAIRNYTETYALPLISCTKKLKLTIYIDTSLHNPAYSAPYSTRTVNY